MPEIIEPWSIDQCRDFWTVRGETYINEPRLKAQFYRDQERIVIDEVERFFPNPSIILEVGCGYGRLTAKLAETFPNARVIGLDYSETQLMNAKEFCPERVEFHLCDDASVEILPDADVIVAVEVLLHVPEANIDDLVSNMLRHSSWTIVDFDPLAGADPAPATHCFRHNVPKLFEKHSSLIEQRDHLQRFSIIAARGEIA